jgi:hypothetical protein
MFSVDQFQKALSVQLDAGSDLGLQKSTSIQLVSAQPKRFCWWRLANC